VTRDGLFPETCFPESGMQMFVQGVTDPKDWPYRFAVLEDAFDLEADATGVQLLCRGCVGPLAPYGFGPSGRTSVKMRTVREFMQSHVSDVHPAWVVGG
jgi:hypothetical protein